MCSSSRRKAICAGIRSGEFLALGVSLEHLAQKFNNAQGAGAGRDAGSGQRRILENNKSPARKVGEIDNRGSHFYLALYWAQALAAQTRDREIQARFTALAKTLADNEAKINAELIAAQGKPVDMGGYYHPDFEKTSRLDAAQCNIECGARRDCMKDRAGNSLPCGKTGDEKKPAP